MASKELGPLPRMKWAALAHGCGRGGRVVLPLARAAAVSTGLRVLVEAGRGRRRRRPHLRAREAEIARGARVVGEAHVVGARVL